uniref:INCENP_ARK-bind domain-containing protein n=1 Tax=Syphacia muris TaxID=451379 RepID=A0A158R481_9BILA
MTTSDNQQKAYKVATSDSEEEEEEEEEVVPTIRRGGGFRVLTTFTDKTLNVHTKTITGQQNEQKQSQNVGASASTNQANESGKPGTVSIVSQQTNSTTTQQTTGNSNQTQRIVQQTTVHTTNNEVKTQSNVQQTVISTANSSKTDTTETKQAVSGKVNPVQQGPVQPQADAQRQSQAAMQQAAVQKAQQEALQRVQLAQQQAQEMADRRKAMLQPQKIKIQNVPQQENKEKEAQERAQKEAQLRAQREAQEKAQKEAQLRAQREAQLRAQKEAQARLQREAEARNNSSIPQKVNVQSQQKFVQQQKTTVVKQAPALPQKKTQPQVPKKPTGLTSTASNIKQNEINMQQRTSNVSNSSRTFGFTNARDDIKVLRGGDVQQNYINNLEKPKEEIQKAEVQPMSLQNDESWMTQSRTVVSDVILPQPSKITIPEFKETTVVQASPTVIVPKVPQRTHFEWKEFPEEEVKELVTIPKFKPQEWKPEKQEKSDVEKSAWVKVKPNEILRDKIWPPPEPELVSLLSSSSSISAIGIAGSRMNSIQWPPPKSEQQVQQDVEILQTRLPVKPHQRQWPPPPPQYRSINFTAFTFTAYFISLTGPAATKSKPVVPPPVMRRSFRS